MLPLRRRIRVVDIRCRTDRHKHLLAIGGKLNVTRPMTVATRYVRDMFGRATGFQITVLIGKAHNRIGVAYIDPLRIGARRIEVDSEWSVQTGGERGRLFRLTFCCDSTEHADLAQLAFRDKKGTVLRSADQPRPVKPGSVQLHL